MCYYYDVNIGDIYMNNIKILIDGDACPSINLIEQTAMKYNIPVVIITDTSHNIVSEYSKVIIVDKSSQSVDIKLVNEVNSGDIVVSQDYGVAAMTLAKNAHCISPRGLIFTNDNIDALMLNRHINQKLRSSGKHVKGPKKRTIEDDKKLIESLEEIINIKQNNDI